MTGPIQDQDARAAIDGAIAFGRMGVKEPPTNHWLTEYWHIGRQLAEHGKTSAWDNMTPIAAATPSPSCATCNGSRVVNDGEITGVGGVEFSNGPIACVKDCPDCSAQSADASNAATGRGREPAQTVAWMNYPVKTANGEFAGHGEPELHFKRQAYGYDWHKARALVFADAAPAPAAQAGEALYRWAAVDGKQHDTGRVTDAAGGFIASTASPEDARMIANALNAARQHQSGDAAADPAAINATQPGDRRLLDLLTQAFGARHEAIDDLAALILRANSKARALPDAARDVLAERHRQVSAEGWTPEHDDKFTNGALSLAAGTYALHGPLPTHGNVPLTWPWSHDGWKPGTPRRNLVKAGALILAEIERFDRAAATAQAKDGA